ncbi:TSUP family transporter, partial [Thermanaerothrix sp.]|uniref:TSUP family transporter n=1 Tax=Thermanaerothrix sp. TaxID=2972675 RepID=UPI002ADE0A48
MDWLAYLSIALAAVAAGAVNALAGGGTLITFPALMAVGVPAVVANVTNTVALLPGYLGGTWAQR